MTEKLTKLLYRKQIAENNLEKYSKGFKIYSNLCENIKSELLNTEISELDKARLQAELDKANWEARIFATNHRSTLRDYEHNIRPIIDTESTDKDKESIDFLNCKEIAEEFAENEIYGKCVKDPENIEHVQMIESIKKYMSILSNVNSELNKKLINEKLSNLEISKLEKEKYDNEIHLQCLTKRLNNRIDYYENQFLPNYRIELAEAKEKIEVYYERGLKLAEAGLDIQLQFVLQKYEEHKNDDERLWLYFTALKARVNAIIDEIKATPKLKKEFKHLTEPI